MNLSIPQPIPILLLSGFLGAGKTTLLNRLLHGSHGLRIAVLVNDFGALNIDSDLITAVDGESISLSNGCICCSIRDDLLIAALQITKRQPTPDYLVIEASGISDPVAIAGTFLLPELQPYLRLDATVTVVDAEQCRAEWVDAELLAIQIAAADIVVLNKADLVDTQQLIAIDTWVRSFAPRTRLIAATQVDVPLAFLLEHTKGTVSSRMTTDTTYHDHRSRFTSWSYQSEAAFSLTALRAALKTLPLTIIRGKGIFTLHDIPSRRAVMHLVGRRASITLGEPWSEQVPFSRLALIGTHGELDADRLQVLFDSCRVT